MTHEPLETPTPKPKCRRWRRWLRHLFVTFHFLLLSTVLLVAGIVYIAFRTDSLDIVNTYLLEPLGVSYSHAEGSLRDGFTLHNLRSEKMEAKTLTLHYSLVKILEGDHTVESIRIDGLRIHLDDFISDDDSPWPLPTFALKHVSLTNLQLISDYPVELDIEAQDGSFDGDVLNFRTFRSSFKSRYADGAISGKVHDNAISGNALLYPNATALAPYSGRFTDLPRSVALQVRELSDKQALLRGKISRLILKQDPTISAEAFTFDFGCRYDSGYLDVDAAYLLRSKEDSMQTKHHLRYAFEGTTTSEFTGVLASVYPLPSNALKGSFRDGADGFTGSATLDGSTLRVSSTDYDRFAWELDSTHQNLAFLPSLPEFLRSSPLEMKARGSYILSNNTIGGTLEAVHNHLRFAGKFSTREGAHSLDGDLMLPPDAPMWKEWSHKPPQHLNVSLIHDHNRTRLQLFGEDLAFTASLHDDKVKGSGNYAGAFFDIGGSISPKKTVLDITTLVPSAFATASKLTPIELYKGEYYDAEIRSKTRVSITDTLEIDADISVPWYAAVLDSQRSFGGTNGSVLLHYRDGNISVERYRFEIADHPITSERTSHLHLSPAGDLIIDDFWIYDTLHLTGKIAGDLSASLRLASERFRYEGPEGSAHASADITFTRDGEGNHQLAGNINILDGTITYLPFQQFKVMDDDVIIVQDVRPPSHTKLSMNLHITAKEPLKLQTKELNILLDPDITLWRDPLGPMQILGMMSIPSGTATTAGKEFAIKHSEIYFGGDIPLNPYLNFTIGYEVDYKKIIIYVTHTLDSPIFLFTSDPVMSQNDIMSYILFGTPANIVAGSDSGTSTVRADATNFMLGAGLKGLISNTTKLQIDTMNILTTKEGGMGFEVGARLNKNLRVLYKNDTLSSILVQYQINRWLRLDADVHELGQGINAVYIKDFYDILPHNKPIKK
jgi:translocation and assembly module TamB